jgi:hypothetical protein
MPLRQSRRHPLAVRKAPISPNLMSQNPINPDPINPHPISKRRAMSTWKAF